MRIRAIGITLAVAAGLVLLTPAAAGAHPLGNFTVNRYSGLVVSPTAVTVDHVLDLAEVPTVARMDRIDRSGDGEASAAELAAYARSACGRAGSSMRLTVGERRADLAVVGASARVRTGQAGLPTLRLECELRAEIEQLEGPTSIELTDAAADDDIGWREITAGGDETTVVSSDVDRESRSARLTSYPEDLLASPLDVRSASLLVRPGGAPAAAATAAGPDLVPSNGVDRLTRTFEGLVERYDGSPLLALFGLVLAFALGAGHALAPGHGKTVMAFYLGGRREGAARAAATVAATVTATHTAGVLLLGVLVTAGTGVVPARLYPFLSVVSGALVAVVGIGLLRQARGGHAHHAHPHPHPHPHSHAEHPHPHPHSHAEHAHPHPHPHAHEHDDDPAGVRTAVAVLEERPSAETVDQHEPAASPGSRRGLVAIGLAGGLLPSPSALLVFLGAVAAGHAWYGVVLVTAFGVGMATTLAAAGILVMRLRGAAERRVRIRARSGAPVPATVARLLRLAPAITATTIVLLGVLIAARGLGGIGG